MSPTLSITSGFAVCTPSGSVLGRTYRGSAEEAIAAISGNAKYAAEFWSEKQREGWSVQPVTALIDRAPQPT